MANFRLTAESSGLVKEVKKARQEMKNLEAQYKNNMSAAELLGTKEEKLTAKINASKKVNDQREQAMGKYNKAMVQLQKEIDKWTVEEQQLIKELENARQAEGDNSKTIKTLEDKLKTLRKQIENNEAVLNDVSKSYYDTSAAVNDTTKEIEEFGEESEEGATAVFSLQDALSSAADMLRDFGDMIDSITNKFENLIKDGIGATVDALAKLGEYSLTTGVNFEKQMSSVAAIMGISKSTEDFQKLTDAAKHYGETTQFTATQAAEALTYLAQAGKKTDEAIGLLPNILNLATAGDLDLGQAASYLVDAESALGDMASQDITGFVDKMAKAATETNTSVALMFEAVLGLGPVGRAVDLDELIATLAKLGDYYLKGSEGGTKLRNILARLQSPTADAAEELDKLGVSVYDADENMKSLAQIFTEMNIAMDKYGYTQKQRNNVFNNIFNVRDKAAAEALGIEYENLAEYAMEFADAIENIDTVNIENYEGSISELVDIMKDCDGAAQDMADTMRDNLWGSLKNLESAIEGFGLEVYDSLLPGVRGAVDNVVQYIREIIDGMNSNVTLSFLGGNNNVINYKKLKQAFNNIGKAISDFAAKIPKILATHTPKIIAVFGKISDIIVKLIEYLPVVIDQLLPALLTHLDNLLGKIPNLVDVVLPKILDFITFVIEKLPFIMTTLYGLQGMSFLGAGALDIGGIVAGIAIAAKAAGTSLGALASAAAPVLAVLAAVFAAITAIIAIIGTAYTTSENFRSYVGTLMDDILDDVSNVFSSIQKLFGKFGVEINTVQDGLNIFLGVIEDMAIIISYFLHGIIDGWIDIFNFYINLINDFVEVAADFAMVATAILTGNFEQAKAYTENLKQSISNTFSNMWNDCRDSCKDFAGDFGNFLTQLGNAAARNPIQIGIEPDLNIPAWEEVTAFMPPWMKKQFDTSTLALGLVTNAGKGSSWVNDVMNGIENANAYMNTTNNNKVTSNTTNNTTTQNINIIQPDPMDPNELFKLSRDQLSSAQFKNQ